MNPMNPKQQLQAASISLNTLQQQLARIKLTLSKGEGVDMGEETIDSWLTLVSNAQGAIKNIMRLF